MVYKRVRREYKRAKTAYKSERKYKRKTGGYKRAARPMTLSVLARTMGAELKWQQWPRNEASVSNGTIDNMIIDPTDMNLPALPWYHLTPVTRGTTAFERTGQKIRLKSLQVKGTFRVLATNSVANAPQGTTIRFGIIHDNAANQTLCSPYDIFTWPTTGPGATAWQLNAANLARNMNKTTQFRIVKDKRIGVAGHGLYSGNPFSLTGEEFPFELYVPLDIDQTYTVGSAGGGIAEVRDNAYHFFALCNSVNYTVSVSYLATCRYYG